MLAVKLKVLDYMRKVYEDGHACSTSTEQLFYKLGGEKLVTQAALIQMLQSRLIVGVLEGRLLPTDTTFDKIIQHDVVFLLPAELFAIEEYLRRREWGLLNKTIMASLDLAREILEGRA